MDNKIEILHKISLLTRPLYSLEKNNMQKQKVKNCLKFGQKKTCI